MLSTEPDVGLELATRRSQPERKPGVGRSTDRITQVPRVVCLALRGCLHKQIFFHRFPENVCLNGGWWELGLKGFIIHIEMVWMPAPGLRIFPFSPLFSSYQESYLGR